MEDEGLLPAAQRLVALRAAYERPHLYAFALAVLGATGLAQLLPLWLGSMAPAWSGAWWGFAWMLAGLSIVVPWIDRRSILKGDLVGLRRRFRWGSLVQGTWALWLAWICPLPVGIISLIFLVMTLHQDAPVFGVSYLRPFYLLLIPSFFALLLLVDGIGGPGLLAAVDAHPPMVVLVASLWLLTELLLVLFLWVQVGQQRAMAEVRRAQEETQRHLALLQAERAVMEQAGPILQVGARVSIVLHDARNQVQAMVSAAELSQELLAEGHSDDGLRRALAGPIDEVQRAALALVALISQLTSAFRESPNPQPVRLPALVDQAEAQLRGLVEGDAALVERSLVDEEVCVGAYHAPILANLMANGLHHGGCRRLCLRAERASPWYITLHVEDQGLDGEARDRALADIRASLDLSQPPAPRGADRPGLGLGLRIIKTLVVCDRGGLFAAPQAGGPGIVMSLWLPRLPPARIPPEASPVG